MKKPTLTEQLLLICALIIIIVIISLGIILPKSLLPIYEENLYNYLEQSLNLLEKPENNKIDSEIAYIFIEGNNAYLSNNLEDIINQAKEKNNLRGSFNKKILLIETKK